MDQQSVGKPKLTFDEVKQLLLKFRDKVGEISGSKLAFEAIGTDAVIVRNQSAEIRNELFLNCFLNHHAFADIIYAIIEIQNTGELRFQAGGINRSMFFEKGDIVFAKSNQQDDRLGEVIYRKGYISVLELANARVSVTKEKRFGAVLLDMKVMNHFQLWQAIRVQIEELIHAIFFMDRAKISFVESETHNNIRIRFQKPTKDFIADCVREGMEIVKLNAMTQDDAIFSIHEDIDETMLTDFEKEFLKIIRQGHTKREIISKSKLSTPYISSVLYHLMEKGLVSCDQFDPFAKKVLSKQELEKTMRKVIDDNNARLSVLHQYIKTHDNDLLGYIDSFFSTNDDHMLGDLREHHFIETGVLNKRMLYTGIQEKYGVTPEAVHYLNHLYEEFIEFVLFEVREFLSVESYEEMLMIIKGK